MNTKEDLDHCHNFEGFRHIMLHENLKDIFRHVLNKHDHAIRNFNMLMDLHAGLGGQALQRKYGISVNRCADILGRTVRMAKHPRYWDANYSNPAPSSAKAKLPVIGQYD